MTDTTVETKEQPCLIQEAYKRAKKRGEKNPILYISCPCPKCSPRC